MSIFIFGGTVEGRTLAEHLRDRHLPVAVCVATEYGASLMQQSEDLTVITGRQTPQSMAELMECHKATVVVDATHPYSQAVTENILTALHTRPVPYIRVERQLDTEEDRRQTGRFFDTMKEAVDYFNTTEGKILITTGSKELDSYTRIRNYERRCILRALPAEDVIRNCLDHGFPPENLILMQGPFSLEMNIATIRQTGCRFLMTRNSGTAGGFPEKAEAAVETGAELVVIGKPKERVLPPEGKRMDLNEAMKYLSQGLEDMEHE